MFRNYVIRNFPFLEDDFDALTDYQLFCKMVSYMKKALIKIDGFEDKLNKYENYFENLNVQEEINNKLDEMAESGELEEIIALFLAYSNILGFDTISDMQESQSLVNGSICKCLGKTNYINKSVTKYANSRNNNSKNDLNRFKTEVNILNLLSQEREKANKAFGLVFSQ